MHEILLFSLLGLGAGSIYALLSIGIVGEQQGSGVVNFAQGAVAMYCAYCYVGLRSSGNLELPVVGIPHQVPISSSGMAMAPAIGVTVLYGAALGTLFYALIFSRLRHAPALAKVVASIGLMLALQAVAVINFGTGTQTTTAILPTNPVSVFGVSVGEDLLWFSGIAVATALVVACANRFTRFGVATRAVSQNQRASALLGWRPFRIEAANWAIASAIAALAGVLAAPITTLTPTTLTLAVVPALAAALVARFTSFTVAAVTGLAIGIGQSLCVYAATKWSWFPQQGMSDALPFIVITVAMLWRSRRLESRGVLSEGRLPSATQPRRPVLSLTVLSLALAVLLVATTAGWRAAVIESVITACLCLSLVLLTGFVGQVSLIQAAFAGFGGFAMAKVLAHTGLPFPVALGIAGLAAVPIGLIVGVPALRIRGINLAIITLGAGVMLDDLVFNSTQVSGGLSGTSVPSPHFLGFNVGINGSHPGDYPRLIFGIVALLVFIVLALLVTNLRRSPTGLKWLAVRSNEPAAASLGIDVAGTKLLAFSLSSFIAGIAGGLIAFQQGQLSPESFTIFVSISVLAITYIGGVGSVLGAVIAGLLLAPGGLGFTVLDRGLSLGAYQPLVAGVGVIISAICNPDGVAAMLLRLRWPRRVAAPVDVVSAECGASEVIHEPALGQ